MFRPDTSVAFKKVIFSIGPLHFHSVYKIINKVPLGVNTIALKNIYQVISNYKLRLKVTL
jgi:hypothetical protein